MCSTVSYMGCIALGLWAIPPSPPSSSPSPNPRPLARIGAASVRIGARPLRFLRTLWLGRCYGSIIATNIATNIALNIAKGNPWKSHA